jgi:hypothetical protein
MRRTSEQVLAEFHRLSDCFERITDCLTMAGFFVPQELRHLIVTRERMVGWIAEGKATPSQILAGVREALNDCSETLTHLLADTPEKAAAILACYRASAGRDYWADAGHPKRMLTAILRRGRLRDETEARLIGSCLADLDQTTLRADQIAAAQGLLAEFERVSRHPGEPDPRPERSL